MSNKDSSLNEDRENVETKDTNLNNNEKKEIGINKSQAAFYKFQIDELKERLEKEEKNSVMATDKWKRALADYQNLEKQTIDRINAREDKIILYFLTVYEDFIRAKNAYEKEGGNVESLNSIIKNMESILDHYEVKPIEVEGKKLDP
ncbi:MAG TPA: nucleotide exchange factor GrpE, partial [Candidatus Marinimicrobia bacterium]|nr:nucleotide exchange factor GrpE [Candidatus Neomarinimicrobiota bacterium]